jgi:effector-binding domain-containing protein
MTPEPEIRELTAQPAAVEQAVTDAAGMAATVDRAFPALFGRLEELGVRPAGPPFIRYLRTGQRLEIQLGVPVPAELEELDETQRAHLPAGRIAVLRHTGPYQGLEDAFEQLQAWVQERGEAVAGPYWEAYVTDPRSEPDSANWITDLHLPLRSS